MINRIVCLFKGHKRGKRLISPEPGFNKFQCQRCKATWTRKAKAA